MTAVQLRNQLIQLIQREGDVKLLELLSKLLDRNSGEGAYRAMLADGADRSEADIAAGRVSTIEEAKSKAKAALRRK
ncbi:MAG: hypothetical protein KF905_04140 [Flavobacteriales bacterium]|nr:hypothetical protein [Flavobacteriales bacterium]